MLKRSLTLLSFLCIIILSSCSNLFTQNTDVYFSLGEKNARMVAKAAGDDDPDFVVSFSFEGTNLEPQSFTVKKSELKSKSFNLENIPLRKNIKIILEVSVDGHTIYRGNSGNVILRKLKNEININLDIPFTDTPVIFKGTPPKYIELPSDSGPWTYVEFGDWPQTKMPENVTVGNEKIKTATGWECYLGSDYCYYVKEKDLYYKLEPIKWRVLDNNYNGTGKKLLLSEIMLTECAFYDDTEVRQGPIYASNYEKSKVRAFLNGYSYENNTGTVTTFVNNGLLQKAFSPEAIEKIATTLVVNDENSATDVNGNCPPMSECHFCDNTNDKIFLPSAREMSTEKYGFNKSGDTGAPNGDMARTRVSTDYATAIGLKRNYYWLRSPADDTWARDVNSNVKIASADVSAENTGIVPALTMSF